MGDATHALASILGSGPGAQPHQVPMQHAPMWLVETKNSFAGLEEEYDDEPIKPDDEFAKPTNLKSNETCKMPKWSSGVNSQKARKALKKEASATVTADILGHQSFCKEQPCAMTNNPAVAATTVSGQQSYCNGQPRAMTNVPSPAMALTLNEECNLMPVNTWRTSADAGWTRIASVVDSGCVEHVGPQRWHRMLQSHHLSEPVVGRLTVLPTVKTLTTWVRKPSPPTRLKVNQDL